MLSSAVTTSSSTQAQLLTSISSIASTVSDPQPPTPVSDAKEKTKEHSSQAHGPQKDGKKTNLKNTTNLKKTEKNITLKIAREEDSLYESTPVSKRSRRRKTLKASDDMDTDANLSDTDYVTDLASEEYESLFEADFKQVAANPLTGPLSPCSPKK
ncbi:hypothetical protein TNIN_194461 [Trichonephila inaurata madagascariensis]|uniref:Uncharacterized protein n=1 Tax=Trichonephila inaurata madagascariensis TaxID=2747483 RepID=A0A8X6WV40_9ARAC|nr:hypothetical protein TNIN_194461 [Trichonephila inaurata madagascariensis]